MKYLSPKKGFLGIDAEQSKSPQVIVVPFGLEKTVSYGGGTKNGHFLYPLHNLQFFPDQMELLLPEEI